MQPKRNTMIPEANSIGCWQHTHWLERKFVKNGHCQIKVKVLVVVSFGFGFFFQALNNLFCYSYSWVFQNILNGRLRRENGVNA